MPQNPSLCLQCQQLAIVDFRQGNEWAGYYQLADQAVADQSQLELVFQWSSWEHWPCGALWPKHSNGKGDFKILWAVLKRFFVS